MVADAPRWCDVLPAIVDYIGDDVVVAHNAGFDIGVIRYACAVENIEWPALRFLCTLVTARRALSCRPTAAVRRRPLRVRPRRPSRPARRRPRRRRRHQPPRRPGGRQRPRGARTTVACAHRLDGGRHLQGQRVHATGNAGLVAADANPDADPDGYLYGRVVVFTGALMSMTRQRRGTRCRGGRGAGVEHDQAHERARAWRLQPGEPSPRRHVLRQGPQGVRPAGQGQDIELMTEDDFLRVLDGGRLDELPADFLTR